MKRFILRLLRKLGNFQAQLFLTILFFLFLTPYALILRIFTKPLAPGDGWSTVEEPEENIKTLGSSF